MKISYHEFTDACQIIADWAGTKFHSVYGIPRGGLVPAVYISHMLDIPLVHQPQPGVLIVDDIADTGKTLSMFRQGQGNIATICYHKQSIVKPDRYIYEKTDEWVVFPWEKP